MKTQECPYTKISEQEANENEIYSGNIVDKKTTISLKDFSLVAKAEAQGTQRLVAGTQNLSDKLTTPFLLLIASFFLFIALMSFVYFYHWKKFTMNDPFIRGFVPVYFFGLVILSVPLIYNLFF